MARSVLLGRVRVAGRVEIRRAQRRSPTPWAAAHLPVSTGMGGPDEQAPRKKTDAEQGFGSKYEEVIRK
jgi:hypothetical protein